VQSGLVGTSRYGNIVGDFREPQPRRSEIPVVGEANVVMSIFSPRFASGGS
jgi:hypothetical protein